MRALLIIFSFLVCLSCKNDRNDGNSQLKTQKIQKRDSSQNKTTRAHPQTTWKKYSNERWNFSLKYPPEYMLLESELPGAPVINIYAANQGFNPPFGIHEDPKLTYLAILPEGFGVDSPSGESKNFGEWDGDLPLNFEINREESTVYLLNSGKAWAYFIRFKNPPSNWKEYSGIFVHFPVANFEARCFNKKGKEKSLEDCEDLGGSDKVVYFGDIDSTAKKKLLTILKSFQFGVEAKKKITELIKIEKPQPNMEVTSPLKVRGEAKGYWFFEADAPLLMLDKNGQKIGESFIKADEDWMTEDFVDFSGTIEFTAPDDERGYLVFKKANPSGLPENDRELKIPVLFPPN